MIEKTNNKLHIFISNSGKIPPFFQTAKVVFFLSKYTKIICLNDLKNKQ